MDGEHLHKGSLTLALQRTAFELRELCDEGHKLEGLQNGLFHWPQRYGLRFGRDLRTLLWHAVNNKTEPSYRATIALAAIWAHQRVNRMATGQIFKGSHEPERLAQDLKSIFDSGFSAVELMRAINRQALIKGYGGRSGIEVMFEQAETAGSYRCRIALAALRAEETLRTEFGS